MDGTIALADGGHLAFEDVGEGPPVVLLHPGLWDMRTWDPQMATFGDAGYRVIRYLWHALATVAAAVWRRGGPAAPRRPPAGPSCWARWCSAAACIPWR